VRADNYDSNANSSLELAGLREIRPHLSPSNFLSFSASCLYQLAAANSGRLVQILRLRSNSTKLNVHSLSFGMRHPSCKRRCLSPVKNSTTVFAHSTQLPKRSQHSSAFSSVCGPQIAKSILLTVSRSSQPLKSLVKIQSIIKATGSKHEQARKQTWQAACPSVSMQISALKS